MRYRPAVMQNSSGIVAVALTATLMGIAPSASARESSLETTARETLDSWLRFQNRGEFEDYQKLYAEKFTGVRRSGTRTMHFDRAGWMKDRERMFRKEMVVSAAQVKISATGTAAIVEFVQTWESGRYKDQGPKRLVMARRPGGSLLITSEEMMSSSMVPTTASDKPWANGAQPWFGVVRARSVVLSTQPEETWAKGAPRAGLDEAHPDLTTVTRTVAAAEVPAELRAWVGRRVIGFDNQGVKVCDTATGALSLVGQFMAHWGEKERMATMKPSEAAAEMWGGAAAMLVGKLPAECGAATWVRAASLRVPDSDVFAEADSALQTKATKAFEALPAYREVAEVAKQTGELEEAEILSARGVVGGKPATIVTVSQFAGHECSENAALLWAIFEVTDKGKLRLRGSSSSSRWKPLLLVDLDGDGTSEILNQLEMPERLAVLRWEGGAWCRPEEQRIPYYNCPC